MIQPTEQFTVSSTILRPKLDLETLIETSLPSLPKGLMRIKLMLSDPNTSNRAISEVISYEPNLVVRLLRLANSTLYLLERNVSTISGAINVIGFKILNDIVMVELTTSAFNKEICKSAYSRKIWEHSLVVALLAREISETLEMRGTEEAFTCGLLHDIGKIILLSNDSEGFPKLLEIQGEKDMLIGEHQTYGYNHAEVGSLIARRWGLPEEIYYTILHHHNPSQSPQPMVVTHIVDIADILANIKGYGVRGEFPEKLSLSESVIKLGLSEPHLENCWNRIQPGLKHLISNFN